MKWKLLQQLFFMSKLLFYGLALQVCFTGILLAAEDGLAKQNKSEENLINSGFYQGTTVTGKVLSGEDNTGLPGVNILVKGTSIGTVTDIEGNYSLLV